MPASILISETDLIHLKNELELLLHELEQISAKGEFSNGNKVAIYLSNIDFEATYSYIEKKDFQISLLRVYSINSMDSQSPRICGIQKDWIQSLKRHSTLISESGESQIHTAKCSIHRIMFYSITTVRRKNGSITLGST